MSRADQAWRVTEVRKLLTIERVLNQPKVSVTIVSKLTSKAQTTIPQPIRAALGLQPGDERRWCMNPSRPERFEDRDPLDLLEGMEPTTTLRG